MFQEEREDPEAYCQRHLRWYVKVEGCTFCQEDYENEVELGAGDPYEGEEDG